MLVVWQTQFFKLVVFGETHFKSHTVKSKVTVLTKEKNAAFVE